MDLKRKENENEESYIWRLGMAKDSGQLDLSWPEIADLINKEFRDDETEYRSEAAYRKPFQQAKRFIDAGVFSGGEKKYSSELELQRRELERLKIQYRDERRSWNKQNYTDARFNEVMNILEERLKNFGRIEFQPYAVPPKDGENSMLVCLSDLHIGQSFTSCFGEYNSEIAKSRLRKYLNKVIQIGKLNHVSKVYVSLLGDNLSGNIHKTIEVSNKENVIDQLKLSIEYISSFCDELTRNFNTVLFSSVSGNHSRIQPKDLAQHSERLDAFIAWDVCRVLEDTHENFHSLGHRQLDDGIADINICGKTYILVHGDYDVADKNGYMRLASMLGFFPDYLVMGHKHFCMYSQESRVIQSGSLAGAGDSYTVEHRMQGKPSQMVCICNDKGVDGIYPVILD